MKYLSLFLYLLIKDNVIRKKQRRKRHHFYSMEEKMEKLLLKNGWLIDKSERLVRWKADVLVEDGHIVKIGENIIDDEAEVIDCEGLYVAPGFIDMHVHVYPKVKALGVEADRVGVTTGVTTVCDAGTAGPENLPDFIENVIKKSRTRVFSSMHFSRKGLEITPEADDESKYDFDLAEKVFRENEKYICAIKARASNTTVGALGIKPIREAVEFAHKIGRPLYVHIGRALPYIEEVFDTLQEGDIITHTFHGKESNWMIKDGKPKAEALRARARGVLFDVGHGEASFSFKTAKIVFPQGFLPDTVSTDLHARNIDGPVYSLTLTMDKMMALGISLEDVVEMVTARPAEYFRFSVPIGKLKVGYCGDFTVFELENGEYHYLDSDKNELSGSTKIVPHYAIVGGKVEMKK